MVKFYTKVLSPCAICNDGTVGSNLIKEGRGFNGEMNAYILIGSF